MWHCALWVIREWTRPWHVVVLCGSLMQWWYVPGVPSVVGAESKFYADFLIACRAYVVGDGSVD